MEATGDRNAFVTETSETDDGLNIRVSTNKIGKKISNKMIEEFGGTVNDAETLVTEDEDGNEVYRVTFAVRLPPYTPGDVIDLAEDDGGPVLVRSARGNLKGVRVTTGERYEASYEEGNSPDARRLGSLEDADEATVVTVEDDNAAGARPRDVSGHDRRATGLLRRRSRDRTCAEESGRIAHSARRER